MHRAAAFFAFAGLVGACQLAIDGDTGLVRCSAEGAVGPPACPEGLACSQGVCSVSAFGLGSPCRVDADCSAGDFCLQPSLFHEDPVATCSRLCCSSTDCGGPESHQICWAPESSGGSYCRKAEAVGRPALGGARVGQPCASDGECRSGICEGSLCADTCCTSATCAVGGEQCVLESSRVADGETWACGQKQGLGRYDKCNKDEDCASGLCFTFGNSTLCTDPCCESTTCGTLTLSSVPGVVACEQVTHAGALVRACAKWLPETASGSVGASCETNEDCRGGKCIGEGAPPGELRCSDTCCNDATCGDTSLFTCRPYQAGASWALRCEAK